MSVLDNFYQHPSGSSSTSDSPAYSTTGLMPYEDLLNNIFTSDSSRESSPQHLLTPPQEDLLTSFPDVHDDDNAGSNFFSLFQSEFKDTSSIDMSTTSADFMGAQDPFNTEALGMQMGLYGMGLDLSPSVFSMSPHEFSPPQHASDDGDDSDEKDLPSPPVEGKEEAESPILSTIPAVKVGGHGKSRKGTVQGGGVTKRVSEKSGASTSAPSSSLRRAQKPSKGSSDDEEHDEDEYDDIPQELRPSPEAFAKMNSKEKRRLRNKISARNFRVRRKEYISTLEGDIEERDRMLDHFRTQLGSREFENSALRQEVSALKKALLLGRGVSTDLPPPAPLPEQSAAETLAKTASSSNSQPVWPNLANSTWGVMSPGGTSISPSPAPAARKGLQENMNPALNNQASLSGSGPLGGPKPNINSFDGFADLNPFTMKTLDAYRMHLWGRMAAQQHAQNQSQSQQSHYNQQQPSGLAATMRPHFFNGAVKSSLPISTAALSGKQATPLLKLKPTSSSSSTTELQREKEHQQAMLAAVASQTIVRKLGSAFWDAFTGSTSSPATSAPSSSPSSSHSQGNWDTDKVQRVLEGKAVLKVVDVESTLPAASKARPSPTLAKPAASRVTIKQEEKDMSVMCQLLEDSMRSLTIAKKS